MYYSMCIKLHRICHIYMLCKVHWLSKSSAVCLCCALASHSDQSLHIWETKFACAQSCSYEYQFFDFFVLESTHRSAAFFTFKGSRNGKHAHEHLGFFFTMRLRVLLNRPRKSHVFLFRSHASNCDFTSNERTNERPADKYFDFCIQKHIYMYIKMHEEEKVIISTLLERRSSFEQTSFILRVCWPTWPWFFIFSFFSRSLWLFPVWWTYHCTDNGTAVHARTHHFCSN